MKTTRRSERKTQTPYARETKGKKVEAKSRIGQEVARALAYALPLYDMPESAVSGPQPGRPAGIVKRYLVKRPSREEMLKGLWLDQAGPEWAKMRSRNPGTMGSSALDSICGYGKFLGNVDFWAKEAGFVAEEERKDSFPMDHGHYWESSTARLVHIVMGYERAVEVGLIPHAFQAYAHSSPDRICLAGATLAGRFPVLASDSTLVLLEIKNPIFGALTLPSWTPHPHTLIPASKIKWIPCTAGSFVPNTTRRTQTILEHALFLHDHGSEFCGPVHSQPPSRFRTVLGLADDVSAAKDVPPLLGEAKDCGLAVQKPLVCDFASCWRANRLAPMRVLHPWSGSALGLCLRDHPSESSPHLCFAHLLVTRTYQNTAFAQLMQSYKERHVESVRRWNAELEAIESDFLQPENVSKRHKPEKLNHPYFPPIAIRPLIMVFWLLHAGETPDSRLVSKASVYATVHVTEAPAENLWPSWLSTADSRQPYRFLSVLIMDYTLGAQQQPCEYRMY